MLSASDRLRIRHYSPLAFVRAREADLTALEADALTQAADRREVMSLGSGTRVLYRRLEWDSRYFGIPMYRLEFASAAAPFDVAALRKLADLYRDLVATLTATHPSFYLFGEVPSEDLPVLQALGVAGFRMVETRLTYYRDALHEFDGSQRFPVRAATEADVANLQDVARRSRNDFDRYHADPFFPTAVADEYVATYAANAVRGLADCVMVPAPDTDPPGAFLASAFDGLHAKACGATLARIMLTAVAPERRGWNKRLNSELVHWYKERGASMIYTTTQATNRAAIRVLESLRYSFGRSAHILATSVPATLEHSRKGSSP